MQLLATDFLTAVHYDNSIFLNSFPYVTVLKSSSFSTAALFALYIQPSQFPLSILFFFRSLPILICFQFSYREAEYIFLACPKCVCWLVCWGDRSRTSSTQKTKGKPSGTPYQVLRAKKKRWLELFYMASGCFFCRPIAQTYYSLNHPASSQVFFSGEGGRELTEYSTAHTLFS